MHDLTPNLLLFWVAAAQGVFYVATGVWGVVHRLSFERVTGPKTDYWLVRTVGTLVAVTGAVLLLAVGLGRISLEILVLAVGNAAALTAIDITYVSKGRIARIYLLDAVAEVILILLWGIGWWSLTGGL